MKTTIFPNEKQNETKQKQQCNHYLIPCRAGDDYRPKEKN